MTGRAYGVSVKNIFWLILLIFIISLAYLFLHQKSSETSLKPINQTKQESSKLIPNSKQDSSSLEIKSTSKNTEESSKNKLADSSSDEQNQTEPVDNPDNKQKDNEDDEIANEGGFDSIASQNIEAVSDSVQQLSSILNSGDNSPANDTNINNIKQSLLNLAKEDTESLNNLINLFEENSNNPSLKTELMDILSTIKDPEVEQLGYKLIESGLHDQIIDGLDLLGQLAIPNDKTLEVTTQLILTSQADVDIILPAIHAMPILPVSSEKRTIILSALSNLSQHNDIGVRSESLLSISQWAKNEQQLSPVIQALQSDTTDDKISAMMALENSPVVSENLKSILLSRMLDNKELWEIRSMAANSLKRFNLSDSEYLAYKDFKNQVNAQ